MKKTKTKTARAVEPALARPWSEARKTLLSAERISANDAEAARLVSLMELRTSRSVTQVELAAALSITQSALSKLEHQHDAKLSTIRNFVEKLGGSLVVKAKFGDVEQEIHIGA